MISGRPRSSSSRERSAGRQTHAPASRRSSSSPNCCRILRSPPPANPIEQISGAQDLGLDLWSDLARESSCRRKRGQTRQEPSPTDRRDYVPACHRHARRRHVTVGADRSLSSDARGARPPPRSVYARRASWATRSEIADLVFSRSEIRLSIRAFVSETRLNIGISTAIPAKIAAGIP